MRKFVLILMTLALAGCYKDPIAVSHTDNQEIQVAELFTHEGVTVYRFYDGGRNVYFTSKATNVAAQHSERCGKGCTHSVMVETLGDSSSRGK